MEWEVQGFPGKAKVYIEEDSYVSILVPFYSLESQKPFKFNFNNVYFLLISMRYI